VVLASHPRTNARATPETVEAFYAIADKQGWLVSEALEQALAALKRELAGQGRDNEVERCGYSTQLTSPSLRPSKPDMKP
jgi:hypothetical protein